MLEITRHILQQKPVHLLEFNLKPPEILDILNTISLLSDPIYKQQLLKKLLPLNTYTDSIYELLGPLYVEQESEFIQLIYVLPNNHRIKLLENRHITSNGTTGLVTWPPSLLLIEYLFEIKFNGMDKRVLELGSGCGLLGLWLKHLGATVTCSDYHPMVLDLLQKNIKLNESKVNVLDLDFTNPPILDSYDLIIGADIVFDPLLIKPLVKLLKTLLSNKTRCILAVTERNEKTFQLFKDELESHKIETQVIMMNKSWFYYREESEISIHVLKTI